MLSVSSEEGPRPNETQEAPQHIETEEARQQSETQEAPEQVETAQAGQQSETEQAWRIRPSHYTGFARRTRFIIHVQLTFVHVVSSDESAGA